jgi:hypothetical protein
MRIEVKPNLFLYFTNDRLFGGFIPIDMATRKTPEVLIGWKTTASQQDLNNAILLSGYDSPNGGFNYSVGSRFVIIF